VTHNNAEWIKVIDSCGTVENLNWAEQYNYLRMQTDTLFPAYLIHEAVVFNPKTRKWIFLPRRASKLPYDPVIDEEMGSNIMLIVDEHFTHVEKRTVGQLDTNWGYSSVKVVPFTNDLMALRVFEVNGVTKTMITVFDENGRFKLEPEYVMISENVKYEGLEFL
jgi:soluble calcium-activated nucleotidase 1